jgi:integrase
LLVRRTVERKLRDDRAIFRDALKQFRVLRRKNQVDARSQNRDRPSLRAQRALMRRRINAARAAAHDCHADVGELIRQLARGLNAVMRRLPRADHRLAFQCLILKGFNEVRIVTVSKSVSKKSHFELHWNNSIALSQSTLTLKGINELSLIMEKIIMKNRYRKFRRGNVWWRQDNQTGKQESLKTKSKDEAIELLLTMNKPYQNAGFHVQMARTHLLVADARGATRTWQQAFDEIIRLKTDNTKARWQGVAKSKPFDRIRNLAIYDTKAEDFFAVLKDGTVSTNVFLRRLHNFALDAKWLLTSVLERRLWPKIQYRDKRAITLDEHKRIVAIENNSERKIFYEICWHIGGSQSDVATLKAENIDWQNRTIDFFRMKTGGKVELVFDMELEKLLNSLPKTGFLFPKLATVKESDRATEFRRRCKKLGISGISLHSYRYAWAQRAKAAGYPERFAQTSLGHGSKAVHRAYSKHGEVRLPSLESFERDMKEKIIALQPAIAA